MRVRTSPTGLYTYPNVVVVRGEPRFLDGEFDTLLNPTLLVEVLSPSTEDYDRGDKFDQYKAIASLREYVLVAQDQFLVERFVKRDKRWFPAEHRDVESDLVLESIGCAVPMRDIYAKMRISGRGDGRDRMESSAGFVSQRPLFETIPSIPAWRCPPSRTEWPVRHRRASTAPLNPGRPAAGPAPGWPS